MRKSRESIENLKGKREKTIEEKLEAIKKDDLERMKENKIYRSPWLHIEPSLLTEDSRDLFSHFEQGQFDIAQGRIEAIREKIEKMKDEEAKSSNEKFIQLMDNKIAEEIATKELKEEKEKDNY